MTLPVVDEQQRTSAREQDEILITVVVDVREERLRRAVEHRETCRLGHVLERAVTRIPEQPVGQTVRLRNVEVIQTVTVEIADRHSMVAHAARREHGVQVRRPEVQTGNELVLKGAIAAQGCLGRLAEYRRRGSGTEMVQGDPVDDAPHAIRAFLPSHPPVAEPLGAPARPRGAGEVEAYGRQRCRTQVARHLDAGDEKLRRVDRLEIFEQSRHLRAKCHAITCQGR